MISSHSQRLCLSISSFNNKIKNRNVIILNKIKDTLRIVGYHFSLEKNIKIYGHGWNFNMADIEYVFERRVHFNAI